MLQRHLTFRKSWFDFFNCEDDPELSLCGGAIAWIFGIDRKLLPEKIRIEFYTEKQTGTIKVISKNYDYWILKKGWPRHNKFLKTEKQIAYVENLMGMKWGKPFYLKVIDLDEQSKLDKAREVCMLGA